MLHAFSSVVRAASRRCVAICAWPAVALLLLAIVEPALAQQSPIAVTATPTAGGSTSYSVPVQTLLFFTLLTFLPAVLLMMTGFTRIVIVLSLLRMALGTQTTPPNQVLIGLSLFLTFFVMGPTFDRIHDSGLCALSRAEDELRAGAGHRRRAAEGVHAADTRATPISTCSRAWRAWRRSMRPATCRCAW